MFISESQLSYGNRYVDLMDVLPTLEDGEGFYDASMVPIVESSTYGRGLVRIEDINAFAEANGIYDMGYAISAICESSGVHPADLLFTIKEETLYLDENLSDIVIEMVNQGIPVASVPISDHDPVAILGNAAVNFLSETGSSYYLDALLDANLYCLMEAISADLNDYGVDEGPEQSSYGLFKSFADKYKYEFDVPDFEKFYGSIKSRMDSEGNLKHTTRAQMEDMFNEMFRDKIGEELKALEDKKGEDKKGEEGAAKGFLANLQKYANKGRDVIAKIIAWANNLVRKLRDKVAAQKDPDKANIIQKLIDKLLSGIDWLTRKMHNTMRSNDNGRTDIGEYKYREDRKWLDDTHAGPKK